MNKNNLSWVDNKIFANASNANMTPQMRPFMDAAPSQFQAAPSPTGLSPATYQEPNANTGVSPAEMMPKAPSGVSPAEMMPKAPQTGVSPAEMMPKAPSGVSPAEMMPKAPMPAAVSPATYQDMTANNANNMGVSPAQYQKDPVIYPVQTGMPSMGGMTPMGAPGGGMPSAGGMTPSGGAGVAGAATGMGMPGTQTSTAAYGPSPLTVQGPPTVLDPGYIPAYLRTQIGKRVRAEFNIGTNLYMDRTGILRDVGISYFVLEDNVTHAMVMCDLYSLKFLTSL
jgi:hypothetical protein